MAQIALYEWVHDGNFNGVMGQSASRVDLTGAFDANPIPTLIMEGEWDLTWGPEKRLALAENHPNAKMLTFEEAGHSIFNEDTEGFFTALQGFLQGLGPVDPQALVAFKAELETWREAWMASPRYALRVVDWGQGASEEIAETFSPGWMEELTSASDYLRLGFALYDVRRYEEALGVFARFEAEARQDGNQVYVVMASIWEAHMLDLLGRRSEAVALYQRVAEMDIQRTYSHDQYGLRYAPSPYAAERIKTPFQRIENRER
jgi:tetratricopeptide (TPR) repeat protein